MKNGVLCICILFANIVANAQSKFVYRNIPINILKRYEVSDESRKRIIASTNNLYDLTKALPRPYVTDGSVDYTQFLQKGINNYQNVIFPNFPVRINDKGITLKSNSIVIFNKYSKIILEKSSRIDYQILRLYNIQDTKVYFASLKGDRESHIGKSGEFGMGISIRGSRNILISNAYISHCWGDGIYLDDFSRDILLNRVHVDYNRRNGVSVVYAKNITINNLLATNT